jgi:hypothetical protein
VPTLGTVINPGQNPEEANASVDSLLNDRTPVQLPAPPSGEVTLFVGVLSTDGTHFFKDARVRELNGADEERIARETKSVIIPEYKFVDMILVGNVEEIGGIKPDREMLRSLLTGDRAHLALEIRKLTFGNDWAIKGMQCRLCQQNFDVIVELDKDISYRASMSVDTQVVVPLKHGKIAMVRLVNGNDEIAVLGDGSRTTTAEQTSAFIDRCLVSIDSVPMPLGTSKQLSVADRVSIVDALRDNSPGPELDKVTIPCEKCGKEADYAVSIGDLFRF